MECQKDIHRNWIQHCFCDNICACEKTLRICNSGLVFLATWGQYKQAPTDILADMLTVGCMSHVHVGKSSKKELFGRGGLLNVPPHCRNDNSHASHQRPAITTFPYAQVPIETCPTNDWSKLLSLPFKLGQSDFFTTS